MIAEGSAAGKTTVAVVSAGMKASRVNQPSLCVQEVATDPRTPSWRVEAVVRPPPGLDSITKLRHPYGFVVEYVDGLRATVLILNGRVDGTTVAARIETPDLAAVDYQAPADSGFIRSSLTSLEPNRIPQ